MEQRVQLGQKTGRKETEGLYRHDAIAFHWRMKRGKGMNVWAVDKASRTYGTR